MLCAEVTEMARYNLDLYEKVCIPRCTLGEIFTDEPPAEGQELTLPATKYRSELKVRIVSWWMGYNLGFPPLRLTTVVERI